MPSAARLTDMFSGICCCHSDPTCIGMGGYIVSGILNHLSQGLPAAVLGSLVIGYCGHPGNVITASSKVSSGGIGTAYLGSAVSGCLIGTIVTGASKHTVGL